MVRLVLNSISSFEFATPFLPWAPYSDLVIGHPSPAKSNLVRFRFARALPNVFLTSVNCRPPYVGSPGVMFKVLVPAPFDQLRLLNLGDPRGPVSSYRMYQVRKRSGLATSPLCFTQRIWFSTLEAPNTLGGTSLYPDLHCGGYKSFVALRRVP